MRTIVFTHSFEKKAKQFLKSHPDLSPKFQKVLQILEKNITQTSLKTHKLSGQFSGLFACSINLSYRIVFTYDEDNVYLVNIGSHDQVY